MTPSHDEPAGSSSGVAQHLGDDTHIRSRRTTNDVENVTAPIPTSPITGSDQCSVDGAAQHDTDASPSSEASRPASPQPARAEQANPRTPEEKQCRICLAGQEEEPELGRLISPCHCRGSIRYVHVNCLKHWRTVSQSTSAFWSCPQCGFRYALARTRAVGLATSPIILSTASIVLFTVIVLLSSFLATWFVPDVGSINEPVMNERVRDSDSFFGFGTVVVSPLDYYTYSWDTARDVFKLAVRTFSDITNLDDEFWNNPDTDDKRPSDGVLGDKQFERVNGPIDGFKSTIKVTKSNKSRYKSSKHKPRTPPSRFVRIVRGFLYRFTTGLGVVGILSFLNLLFSFGLVAPLRLFGGNWNRQRRGANGDTASLVLLVFVVIGIARAIWLVYKLTRHIAQILLRRAETAILEVGQVEEDLEPWSVYIRRQVRELPMRVRTIPYRLLPSMIFGWSAMIIVQAWHFTRNWTRDVVGQMMHVGPMPAQRGVFVGDW